MNYKKVDDIEGCLRKYFSTDKDLIDKWHIASGKDLEHCVQRTLKDLKTNVFPSFVFYEIENDVGFFGIEESGEYLTTFFINPKNRNKEDIKVIWNTMLEALKPNFKSGLFKKNTPAINFFLKNEGRMIAEGKHNNEDYIIFEFNRR
jgi:hypothetical protein